MIDDNDPFIKERSIVCLKFLLADLEAKKTYDDQALKEVGYEVEIKEGQVQLKQLQDLKNLQDKISSKKNAF
ncbi:copper transport protein [Cerrena zonata]|uniref:Copper transport protein n=1 Tax=Cerrena zonata TaxID=2478898 RepID=A0AAW0FLL9_9APHY